MNDQTTPLSPTLRCRASGALCIIGLLIFSACQRDIPNAADMADITASDSASDGHIWLGDGQTGTSAKCNCPPRPNRIKPR